MPEQFWRVVGSTRLHPEARTELINMIDENAFSAGSLLAVPSINRLASTKKTAQK